MEPNTIVITIEGGLVQDVSNIPPGMKVVVRDYDCEGADDDELSKDERGDDCYVTVWEAE